MTKGTQAKHSTSKGTSTNNTRTTPVNELLSQEVRDPVLSYTPFTTVRTSSQSTRNSSTDAAKRLPVNRETIAFYLQEALDLPDASDYEYNFDMSESTDATDSSEKTW
jgi:hypothetical protein